MEEAYLHREKEYLKINAQLDNRFKEIKITDNCDQTKPRLNVFGNGSKGQKQANIKSVVQNPKPKQNEVRVHGTIATTSRVEKVANSKNINNCESSRCAKANEKLKILNGSDIVSSSSETPTKKNISSEGLIKFLKSKVAILQQELGLSQQENAKKLQAYENIVETCKKHSVQMDHVMSENEALKKLVDRLQETNKTSASVIEEKDADLTRLHKDSEDLKRKLKEANQTTKSLENRLLKCQDDLEHTKQNLHHSADGERQQRTVNNQQRTFFEDQIKALSKQRTGLISAYKKQLLLLDNLKRQNVCLEQSKLIQIAEKDFMKILDWNN